MEKNKISIEFHSILKDLLRNIWVVILSALIGSMGFFLVSHTTYKPAYTSTATLAVLTGGANSGSYSTLTASIERANVLINILTEPSVKEAAAEYLGIESFDGTISASILDQTNFIELKVTSDQPEKSYKLLSAVLKSHHRVSSKVISNAGLSVIRMPNVPTVPSNRISESNRNLVVTACATLSLVIILVLSLTRNTIKKQNDFDEKIDSKLIGTIAHENKKMTLNEIKQKKKKGLLIHSNAYISLRFTENFHKIAAKLEHMKKSGEGKVFAITSVAENEGKSTCAANLAVSLADRGNKVVLVDLDIKKPAIFKIFEEEFTEEGELSNLLNNEISFENFKFRPYKKTSLSLALNTKPHSDYQSWITNNSISDFLEELKKDFDFVIVDSAPLSLDSSVTDIINMVDKTLLVVRTDVVNANVLNEFIETISKISANLAGCILNDVYMNILPFSFTGNDESNYYGKYSHYGHYGHYGHYANYRKHHQHKSESENKSLKKAEETNFNENSQSE